MNKHLLVLLSIALFIWACRQAKGEYIDLTSGNKVVVEKDPKTGDVKVKRGDRKVKIDDGKKKVKVDD